MSRAFVKEVENGTAELPDRPISPHRNFVTHAGLAAIEAALGRFEAAHRAATDKGDGAAHRNSSGSLTMMAQSAGARRILGACHHDNRGSRPGEYLGRWHSARAPDPEGPGIAPIPF
jgi:hypothetical protein